MTTIGYIRVSTDKQDLEKQKHLLLEYAQQNQLLIKEFITVEISSRENTKERRIDELLIRLKGGDTLIVVELSRLGRNMRETLNIINELSENGVKLVFVRQPELSTIGPHGKLLLARRVRKVGSRALSRDHLSPEYLLKVHVPLYVGTCWVASSMITTARLCRLKSPQDEVF